MRNHAENQARERQKNFDIKSFTEKAGKGLGTIQEMVSQLAEEVKKVNFPKDKKDVRIRSHISAISLLEDGRVFIQFPVQDAAEKYYLEPPTYTADEVNEQCKTERAKGILEGSAAMNATWLKKSWWKRLWKL